MFNWIKKQECVRLGYTYGFLCVCGKCWPEKNPTPLSAPSGVSPVCPHCGAPKSAMEPRALREIWTTTKRFGVTTETYEYRPGKPIIEAPELSIESVYVGDLKSHIKDIVFEILGKINASQGD